jgi:hypothetical protein
MNIGFLLLLIAVMAYILCPPIFMEGPYIQAVRERYTKLLGGTWSRKKISYLSWAQL